MEQSQLIPNDIEARLVLKIEKGDLKGHTYEIRDQRFQGIISRGHAKQIVLDDPTVSAPHAALAIYHMHGNRTDRIRDLGSKNGTYLNGKKLSGKEWIDLKDGDLIECGRTRLRYIQATRQLICLNKQLPPVYLEGSYLITRRNLPFVNFKSSDPTISVPHLSIKATDSFLEIRDLSSRNGVSVYGEPVNDRQLIFPHDLIQFGRETEIKVITHISGIPEIIDGRWQRLQLIDEGGMAVVYKAKNIKTSKIRAMKIPHPKKYRGADYNSQYYRRLFRNEIDLAKDIHHDNLVEAYEEGEVGPGLPYLIMDYIEGPSLNTIMRRQKRISAADIADTIIHICGALHYLHVTARYIHCDIRPDNILLDRRGKVYLTDFGVATKAGDKYSRFGNPEFLPKEIWLEDQPVSAVTDIYALGQVITSMLGGFDPPKSDVSDETVTISDRPQKPLATQLKQTINTLGQSEKALFEISKKCIAERPRDRYQAVRDLMKDLLPLAVGSNLGRLVHQTGWRP